MMTNQDRQLNACMRMKFYKRQRPTRPSLITYATLAIRKNCWKKITISSATPKIDQLRQTKSKQSTSMKPSESSKVPWSGLICLLPKVIQDAKCPIKNRKLLIINRISRRHILTKMSLGQIVQLITRKMMTLALETFCPRKLLMARKDLPSILVKDHQTEVRIRRAAARFSSPI